MAADGTLMTVSAVTFIGVGMAAAVGRHRLSPRRTSGNARMSHRPGPVGMLGTVSMLGMGAIMLGMLVVPDFSRVAAASLTVAALLLALAGVAAVRISRKGPLRYGQKAAVAVSVVDISFMSAAVLLMPTHSAVLQLASSVQLGAHAGASHLAVAGGMMIWLVLVVWAFCAAVLIVPAILRRSPDGAFQLVCSGCMIGAMAAMAV